MTGARLRPAGPPDAAGLLGLIRAAYRGEGGRRGWTTEADLVEGGRVEPDELAAALADPAATVLVAEEDGRLVGCCQLRRHDADTAGFGLFAVDPDRQGGGLGHRLLAAAEGLAADWGCRRLRLEVLEPRRELLDYYRRRGYRATGARRPFEHGDEQARVPGLAFVELAKELGPVGGASVADAVVPPARRRP